MQTTAYNPVRARDIAFEMASLQRDRGYSLTREDFRKEGFSDEQITKFATDAGVLYARMERGIAA